MQLLVFLAEHAGEVLSRDVILNSVWGEAFVSDQVLTNAVWQIRHAFGDQGRDLVQTIPKNGYRLCAPPEPLSPQLQLVHDRDAQQNENVIPDIDAHGSNKNRGFIKRLVPIWKRVAILTLAVAALLYVAYALMKPPATLAVLPFQNVSGDERQEFSSEVFTEQLIQTLSKSQSRKFGVIAWSAVVPYKNSTKPVQEIGRQLKARYVMEGRMWQNGSLTHVSVELVEVGSQRQIWSANFEHAVEDLATLQAGIAEEVSETIQGKPGKRK